MRFADVTGAQLWIRVYVTPAGGKLNMPGHPEALALYFGRDSGARLESEMVMRLQGAGFPRMKDIWGFKPCRRLYPLAGNPPPRSLCDRVVDEMLADLGRGGVLSRPSNQAPSEGATAWRSRRRGSDNVPRP